MPTDTLYLGAFLIGVALLAVVAFATPRLNRPLLLWMGTSLSALGLSALSLQIDYGRRYAHPPNTPAAHLTIVLSALAMSLAAATLLIVSLKSADRQSGVGTVTSAFVPLSGTGLTGRVQLDRQSLTVTCPPWVLERPRRGDKVRCIGPGLGGEYLVVLKDSDDDQRWQRGERPK